MIRLCFFQQTEDHLVMLSDGELRTVADGDRGWQHPPVGHKQVPAERTRHLPGRRHAEVSPHSIGIYFTRRQD